MARWLPARLAAGGRNGGAIEVAEPIVFIGDPETERWIEIRDRRGRLITVIEVLSPANKREPDWAMRRSKQRDLAADGVSLVEIDLLRGGHHVTAIDPARLTCPPGTCHHVCVTRSSLPGQLRIEVYLCPLREPLPAIPTCRSRCNRSWTAATRSAATGSSTTAARPEPPVAPEDEAWLDERLRAAGLR